VAALAAAAGIGSTVFVLAGAALLAVWRKALQRADAATVRLKGVLDQLPSAAWLVREGAPDDALIVADGNVAATQLDGTCREEMVGRPLGEIVSPGIRSALLEAARRVARGGGAERLYDDGGASGPCREYALYSLPSGEIVVLCDDVTLRKRAEAALRESEERWRAVIEMHVHAIVIVDQSHAIRFVNRAAETLFGKPAHELIGAAFGHPLVGEVAEIEILRPGQGVAYAEMRGITIHSGAEEQFLLFLQDVSAYKRAEGDLRKLFQAIEQSPASVVITDVEGRIEYVNPKFTETTGYTYPEVNGKNPRFLKSGTVSPGEYEKLWETIVAGRVWRGELQNKRKNGDLFWELVAIAPVRDLRGKITHYVAVKEDISERKATEERLRQSQKMETIGQLTGGLAHDFNNLLAIITGNLQLLEENRDLDHESRELIADALWSAERGAQLTHRLLAFARRQRLNPKVTDLNKVVGEMTDLLRRTMGERIEIKEHLTPQPWLTMIDRGQLESTLLNLVVNARDAMLSGGVLTIITANERLPAVQSARDGDPAPGDYVMLAVSDTGTGMPPEVLERIFEPFFTTKRLGEGSGLGLSMVYGFVRQSGGSIAVDSTLGKGTTVRIYLPRTGADLPLDAPAEIEPRMPAASASILLVEDDPRVRKAARLMLVQEGYTVVEAADAHSALALLEKTPRIDLLFTDVVLPNGLNGMQLAEQVVRRQPETKVLFTSGYATASLFAEGPWDGAGDLLLKPYRRRDLIKRIRDLIEQRRAATAAPAAEGSAAVTDHATISAS
jgi:PAS domain S-box-containing protein